MEKEGVAKGHGPEEKKKIVVVRTNAVEVVPKGPTNVEKVAKYLKDNPHKYCDDCLSAELGIDRHQINAICRETLKRKRRIKRTSWECFRCGKVKEVNKYVERPTTGK
jgi:hypothetical protein